MVELLLNAGADPNQRTSTSQFFIKYPLELAASVGNEACIRLLLNHGVVPKNTSFGYDPPRDFARINGPVIEETFRMTYRADLLRESWGLHHGLPMRHTPMVETENVFPPREGNRTGYEMNGVLVVDLTDDVEHKLRPDRRTQAVS